MKEKPENATETLYHNYLQVIMGKSNMIYNLCDINLVSQM